MTDVEWPEPADPRPAPAAPDAVEPPPEAPPAPPRGRRIAVLVLDVVLSLAAVAALVAAGYGRVYSLRLRTRSQISVDEAVDGWGRYTWLSGDPTLGQHGTRYGIAVAAAGALVLAGVLLRVAGRREASRRHRVAGAARALGRALPLLAAGAVAATLTSAVLEMQAVESSYRAALRRENLDPSARNLGTSVLDFDRGWFFGLGVIGAVLALLAVLIGVLFAARTGAPPRRAIPAAHVPTTPPDPDDEELVVR